jgi:hypothetical protein
MIAEQLLNKINEKERELNDLNSQYAEVLKEKENNILKTKGFDKVIYLLNSEFESSSGRTEQYLKAYRIFKSEFTKVLKPLCKKIEISKPNHFDITGFFQLNDNRIYYFSIGDLRWDKIFLIRIADHFKDYTGGSNNFLNLDNNFIKNLLQKLEDWKEFDKIAE